MSVDSLQDCADTRLEGMTYVARHVEAQLLQSIPEAFTSNIVKLVERQSCVFPAQRNAAPLDLEDNLVEILLGRCELAVDGPCASDVCYVTSVFLGPLLGCGC